MQNGSENIQGQFQCNVILHILFSIGPYYAKQQLCLMFVLSFLLKLEDIKYKNTKSRIHRRTHGIHILQNLITNELVRNRFLIGMTTCLITMILTRSMNLRK